MKRFMKDWGFYILFMTAIILSRLFWWQIVTVDGHSMDPTLANKEKLFVLSHTKLDRQDIVVASEEEDGQKKVIVKRIIGLPGDTITYKNDSLTVNGKEVKEPYLVTYQKQFQKDKLQSTYSYNNFFQNLAQNSTAFTTDKNGSNEFTVKVPKGQYYLIGDDRIVSKDSRAVGSFAKNNIIGEVKFRLWPFNRIGTVD